MSDDGPESAVYFFLMQSSNVSTTPLSKVSNLKSTSAPSLVQLTCVSMCKSLNMNEGVREKESARINIGKSKIAKIKDHETQALR